MYIYGRTRHIYQRILHFFFSEGNFLMFQSPVVELQKIYSSDSPVTTKLDPFLAYFIRHKEEVGF